MRVLDGADEPLPELHRLRVWIVHAERAHAVADPEFENPLHLFPEWPGILALEVQRVDVLVLLRRVLRVLDGAIGPMEEPLRVLADPGMVRRALDREVQRDLEPEPPRALDEPVEVVERAEIRMDGRETAVRAADRPRAPPGARRSDQREVAPLAVRASDRVNGR